jgi:hypothetical protein
MLGFNPFSDLPISSIELPVITGTIYADDENDTANIQAAIGAVNTATISATDDNDTSTITANVTDTVTATISANDENDTSNIIAINNVQPSEMDMHDGFTRDEIRRARELQKKLEKARQKLFEAQKAQKLARKQQIRDIIDPPVAKTQQTVIQSVKNLKEEALVDVIKASAAVKRLELQQRELERAILLRQEQIRIQTELAILKAKQLAELDDEEALLLLL